MTNDDLVFSVQLDLKPECVDEWKVAVMALIEQMAQESTFVACYLDQDAQEPNRFKLFERWAEPSVEAFVANQFEAKDYRRAYEARLPALLQRPRVTTVLRGVREWHRGSARGTPDQGA